MLIVQIPSAHRWSVAQCWETAVEVTAAAYHVDAADLGAPSKGVGARPVKECWEARKIAVQLAVMLAECSYAALGRVAGLHRDTVAAHCAEVRDELLKVESVEAGLLALERLARGRLDRAAAGQLDAVRAHLAMLEEATGDLLPSNPSPDRHPTLHPTTLARSRKRETSPSEPSK